MDTIKLEVITPQGIFFEGPTAMVIISTTAGELGIMPGHIPLTGMVASTVLYFKETMDKQQKKCSVHKGFVRVLPDKVTVCVANAEWPDQIDEARAEAAKERAMDMLERSKTNPDIDVLRAEAALQRAMARLTLIK